MSGYHRGLAIVNPRSLFSGRALSDVLAQLTESSTSESTPPWRSDLLLPSDLQPHISLTDDLQPHISLTDAPLPPAGAAAAARHILVTGITGLQEKGQNIVCAAKTTH